MSSAYDSEKGVGGEASGHPASCHVGWGSGVGQHTVHFHLFCTSRTFFVSPALICLLAGFPGPPNFFSGFCIFSASCSSFTSLHLCHVASLLFTLHFRCTWPRAGSEQRKQHCSVSRWKSSGRAQRGTKCSKVREAAKDDVGPRQAPPEARSQGCRHAPSAMGRGSSAQSCWLKGMHERASCRFRAVDN